MKKEWEKFPNVLGARAAIYYSPEDRYIEGRIVKSKDYGITIETDDGRRISCNSLRTELYHEVIYKKPHLDIKFAISKALQRL